MKLSKHKQVQGQFFFIILSIQPIEKGLTAETDAI